MPPPPTNYSESASTAPRIATTPPLRYSNGGVQLGCEGVVLHQDRQEFANDPRNLQATDGAINEQKATAMPLPGCRPIRLTAAHTCPNRSRSRLSMACGSPGPNTTRSPTS